MYEYYVTSQFISVVYLFILHFMSLTLLIFFPYHFLVAAYEQFYPTC